MITLLKKIFNRKKKQSEFHIVKGRNLCNEEYNLFVYKNEKFFCEVSLNTSEDFSNEAEQMNLKEKITNAVKLVFEI